MENIVSQILLIIIQWIIAPLSLIAILVANAVYSFRVRDTEDDDRVIPMRPGEQRKTLDISDEIEARKTGYIMGWLIFLIVLLIRVATNAFDPIDNWSVTVVELVMWATAGGVVGLFNLLLADLLGEHGSVGLVVAASVAGAASSFLFYILNQDVRILISVATFGYLVGVQFYALWRGIHIFSS